MFKKNLIRKDIANKINQKMGFSKNISSEIVDIFFDSLSNELIKKEKIKISSFGTFRIINKKERVGRNPKTKVSAKISARKVVSFKPSMIIKKKLNSK